MKKRLGLIITLVFVAIVTIHFVRPGGLESAAFSTIFRDDTVYADSYSLFAWHRISSGMSKIQVEQVIGKPISIWQSQFRNSGNDIWDYSKSPGDTHYEIRQIEFGSDSLVQSKVGYFFVD